MDERLLVFGKHVAFEIPGSPGFAGGDLKRVTPPRR
jgi:hypothetical protein